MLDKLDVFKDKDTNEYQLRTKSTVFSLEFDDLDQEKIFIKICDLVKDRVNHSIEKLRDSLFIYFPNIKQSKVFDVLDGLSQNDLLPLGLSSTDNDGVERSGFSVSIDEAKIALIGDSQLKIIIAQKAQEHKFNQVTAFEFNEADIDDIFSNNHFVIVDNMKWNPYYLEIINKKALEYNKPWLYVEGIDDGALKLGPLFYGKETGCYNCLISRIKSNQEHVELFNKYEFYLRENKRSSVPDLLSYSDSVLEILANMVLLEVVKFFEGWSLPIVWKRVVKIDLIKYSISKHDLLKKPYCEVCKPELSYNAAPWLEAITLNEVKI
tara:strand:+ start:1387 stop:2355 length:969 start_codon:yes stop_codon:yes gene_type:complete